MLEKELKQAKKKLLDSKADASSYRVVRENHPHEIDAIKPKLDHLRNHKVNHSKVAIIKE